MPPRPKFTRDEVIDIAYEIARSEGIEAVVAREVGKRLGTTATPIFTYFEKMSDLKDEIYHRAQQECAEYMRGCMEYRPAFKEFGMRWVRFAKNEPKLYNLLFLSSYEKQKTRGFVNIDFLDVMDELKQSVMETFRISAEQTERLINDMCIYSQGLAAVVINTDNEMSEERISACLSNMCISLVAGYKLRDGNYHPEMMEHFFANAVGIPKETK